MKGKEKSAYEIIHNKCGKRVEDCTCEDTPVKYLGNNTRKIIKEKDIEEIAKRIL